MRKYLQAGVACSVMFCAAFSAHADTVYLPDSVAPFDLPKLTEEEISKASLPELNGPITALDEQDFDKYYYFHRADTDVPAAFQDVAECDGYARGLQSGLRYAQAPYPYTYTMAGAVGGAIGNALAMAIVGSAEKRKLRRTNMRFCMNAKGYQRYGISKNLWEKFNFEEGLNTLSEDERHPKLLMQALVAAKANPVGKVLEP